MDAGVTNRLVRCEMRAECEAPVTHIGSKGYVYCAAHAVERTRYTREFTRRLRRWELWLLQMGKPLPSYAPRPLRDELGQIEAMMTAHEMAAFLARWRRTGGGK